jgi:hypothetical protein
VGEMELDGGLRLEAQRLDMLTPGAAYTSSQRRWRSSPPHGSRTAALGRIIPGRWQGRRRSASAVTGKDRVGCVSSGLLKVECYTMHVLMTISRSYKFIILSMLSILPSATPQTAA